MVIVIEKGASKKTVKELLRRPVKTTGRGFDAKKYSGKLKLKFDPVEMQRSLRDEWD